MYWNFLSGHTFFFVFMWVILVFSWFMSAFDLFYHYFCLYFTRFSLFIYIVHPFFQSVYSCSSHLFFVFIFVPPFFPLFLFLFHSFVHCFAYIWYLLILFEFPSSSLGICLRFALLCSAHICVHLFFSFPIPMFHNNYIVRGFFAVGQFATGQFAVRNIVSFGQVRLS